MTIVVCGSLNMDVVARSPRLPQPGETLIGTQFETIPGGKGANQAVAIGKLGLPVALIGRVGADDFGQGLLAALTRSQVKADGVYVDPQAHTGMAVITVDDQGENTIIVVPGANAQLGEADLQRLQMCLQTSLQAGRDRDLVNLLLLQLEIPLPIVTQAAQLAQAAGFTVILDPAPAQSDLPADLYAATDILTPNQVEAEQLTGIAITDVDRAAQAGQQLRDRGCDQVLVKLGAGGVVVCTAIGTTHVPAYPVQAVDTVAAGDAFNGGLAVALAQGQELTAAVVDASAVAALSVTRPGAQSSLPTASEVAAFLALGRTVSTMPRYKSVI